MFDVLESRRSEGELSAADLAFARVITVAATEPNAWLALAAALASAAVQRGDVCVTLDTVMASQADVPPDADTAPVDAVVLRAALLASGIVQDAVEPVSLPLVLDSADRLYLARYWQDEMRLARALLARMDGSDARAAPPRALLDSVFPPVSNSPDPAPTATPDWQRVAAVVASRQRLCVITGGPGTGKTRTVARLLAVLQSQSDASLDMALLAPTGKAAARLLESLRAEVDTLAAGGVAVSLPDTASTLHRALGYRHGRRDFHHNAVNPLPHDVVLVDEASMIDLSMMTALVDALRPDSRLVLLGDRDQLASVEAGNVLGDIVGATTDRGYSPQQAAEIAAVCDGFESGADSEMQSGTLADAIVHLRHSYRFDAASGIGVFAAAVNAGQVDEALEALHAPAFHDLDLTAPDHTSLVDRLEETALPHFRELLASDSAEAALRCLARFRVLCAMRKGPAGVDRINEQIEQLLARRGLLQSGVLWYPGRPLLITRNDSVLGLYNGDMGVVWPDADGNPLARFAGPDGQLRSLAPGRLPAHETCHAMTVHKTQGSEFERIVMVLPEPPQPLLSRDLLYTGVTRARSHVEVYGSEAAVRAGTETRRERASGLRERLWGADAI